MIFKIRWRFDFLENFIILIRSLFDSIKILTFGEHHDRYFASFGVLWNLISSFCHYFIPESFSNSGIIWKSWLVFVQIERQKSFCCFLLWSTYLKLGRFWKCFHLLCRKIWGRLDRFRWLGSSRPVDLRQLFWHSATSCQ